MSLKSKIEAVIYASEEPVTLVQLVGLLAEEAMVEVEQLASLQSRLPLETDEAGSMRNALGTDTDGDVATASSLFVQTEVGEPISAERSDITGEEDDSVKSDAETVLKTGDSSATGNSNQSEIAAADLEGAAAGREAEKRRQREKDRAVRDHLRRTLDGLMRDYTEADRGIEVREVAGGFRMGTKPEYHDAVRGFVRSLTPALKLSLQALETLAAVAYRQPVTAAEISEIRGVDSAGVLGGLIARKLIATAGRKQVIGRPMLYKTTKEFLVRFGLKDVHELPSMEEFERMAGELNEQEDLPMEPTESVIERANARGDADHVRETTEVGQQLPGHQMSVSAEPADGSSAAIEVAAANTKTAHVSGDVVDQEPAHRDRANQDAAHRNTHAESAVPNAIESETTEEATV